MKTTLSFISSRPKLAKSSPSISCCLMTSASFCSFFEGWCPNTLTMSSWVSCSRAVSCPPSPAIPPCCPPDTPDARSVLAAGSSPPPLSAAVLVPLLCCFGAVFCGRCRVAFLSCLLWPDPHAPPPAAPPPPPPAEGRGAEAALALTVSLLCLTIFLPWVSGTILCVVSSRSVRVLPPMRRSILIRLSNRQLRLDVSTHAGPNVDPVPILIGRGWVSCSGAVSGMGLRAGTGAFVTA
mmetsp:Transcript_18223/g.51888  ORF Transcript_18223/g.51888 Transcript_18223/m.51888 type:complete len:237 (-) Transcript_18223:393-1103(-)